MVNHDQYIRLPWEWRETLSDAARRIIIVGGGTAGLRTVEALQALGFPGSLLGINAAPLPPYDRAQLSTVALSDPGRHDMPTPSSAKDVWWFFGHKAVGLDLEQRQVKIDGRRIDFDGLVIATGRRARTLTSAPEALHLRTMADAERLRSVLHAEPRHLVVVGGGLTGMEVASAASVLGWEVTVADSNPHPLAQSIGAITADWVWRTHRNHGVRLKFGDRVVAVHPGARQRVEFATGSTIDADVVLACIGTTPNTQWLARSGLDLTDGVRTDERQQALTHTGELVDGVVAVGDIVSHRASLADGRTIDWNHWDHTVNDAHRAAAALLGQRPPSAIAPTFTTRLYTHEIHVAGLPQGHGDRLRGRTRRVPRALPRQRDPHRRRRGRPAGSRARSRTRGHPAPLTTTGHRNRSDQDRRCPVVRSAMGRRCARPHPLTRCDSRTAPPP